ncbi:response regulator [Bowmanella sp. Y26]|uniref:response regulator n=1 Tax=Bowmanella yangjiangensis TaxID=2811230 RepID=UPI001BDD95B8|nr:response regulator [Bowmanella yangjiangensis]
MYPAQLRVLIVEDNQSTRHLLRDMLIQLGVEQLEVVCNGPQLLKQHNVVHAELLLLGYDLGDLYTGTDLLRFLIRTRRISEETQTAFISNQKDAVLADLPYRTLPTPVLVKPLSKQTLETLIHDTCRLLRQIRPLQRLRRPPKPSNLLQSLMGLDLTLMEGPIRDTLITMQIQELTAAGYAHKAYSTADKLTNQQRLLEAQMNIAYLQGNLEELQLIADKVQHSGLLRRKLMWFKLRVLSAEAKDDEFINVLKDARESQLSPTEVMLKATVLYILKGYPCAGEYLKAKYEKLLQDSYIANVILLWAATLALINKVTHSEKLDGGNDTKWYFERLNLTNFSQNLHRFGKKLYHIFNTPNFVPEHSPAGHPGEDVFEHIVNACSYLVNGKTQDASEELYLADRMIAEMQLSPERSCAGLLHKLLFKRCQANSEQQAREYIRWASSYHHTHPYRSIKMYFNAYKAEINDPQYALALYLMLKKYRVNHYWGLDLSQLARDIGSLRLSSQQQESWRAYQAMPEEALPFPEFD